MAKAQEAESLEREKAVSTYKTILRRLLDNHLRASIYKRFARWCDKGVWERMHQHFVDEPDMEHIILDSTVIRAHPCAAGALKKTVVKQRRPLAEAEVASAPKST